MNGDRNAWYMGGGLLARLGFLNTDPAKSGLSLTPSADLPLFVGLGVQGYVGKREGVTGSLMVKWTL